MRKYFVGVKQNERYWGTIMFLGWKELYTIKVTLIKATYAIKFDNSISYEKIPWRIYYFISYKKKNILL